MDIFTRKPFLPKQAAAHDRIAYLGALVEVEQLEQDQRSLVAAFDEAVARLADREPDKVRASNIRKLRRKAAEQYAELLREIGSLTGSQDEDACLPPPDEPA